MNEELGPIEGEIRRIIGRGVRVSGRPDEIRQAIDPTIQDAFVALARHFDAIQRKISGNHMRPPDTNKENP